MTPAQPPAVCACGAVEPLTLAQAPKGERDDSAPALRGTLVGTCAGAGLVALAYGHGAERQVSATRTGADGAWSLEWPRDPTRPLMLLWGCDVDGDGSVGGSRDALVEHVDLGAARAWTSIPLRHRTRDAP